jgi:hypothetical protein
MPGRPGSGPVVLPLEGEELVDGGDGGGVLGADSKLTTIGQRFRLVGDT